MRRFVILLSGVLTLAGAGCGGKPPPPPDLKGPPLSVAEWEKIQDPEEKFNRATLSRLPKVEAARMMKKYKK